MKVRRTEQRVATRTLTAASGCCCCCVACCCCWNNSGSQEISTSKEVDGVSGASVRTQ